MEISERFGFNLPSRDGDDLADINQISNNFRIVEDVVPYVDENYDPKSKNPQSGKAVFGAIKTVRNPILDYIVYEIVEDGTVDIVSCDRAIKGDYIIPDTIDGYPVTSIGKSFSPASRWAFEGCENLTSIVIPDSVTLIGISAFSSCYNLKKIVMGSGVSTIGESAFYNCLALKEITISENITKIDTGVFEKVDNLADVYYNGTPEQWNEIIVRGINEPLVSATIHFNYDPTLTTKGYVDEALRNAVDQTYSPESTNAQSGKAVAEALTTVGSNDFELIGDLTITEDVAEVVWNTTDSGEPLTNYKDFFIYFLGNFTATENKALYCRANGGGLYFMWLSFSKSTNIRGFWIMIEELIETDKIEAYPNHATYKGTKMYKTTFPNGLLGNVREEGLTTQGLADNNRALYSDFTIGAINEPIEKLHIGQTTSATSIFASGSRFLLFGRKA